MAVSVSVSPTASEASVCDSDTPVAAMGKMKESSLMAPTWLPMVTLPHEPSAPAPMLCLAPSPLMAVRLVMSLVMVMLPQAA